MTASTGTVTVNLVGISLGACGGVVSVESDSFRRFFLFFRASTAEAAGPLVRDTRASVVDLGSAEGSDSI